MDIKLASVLMPALLLIGCARMRDTDSTTEAEATAPTSIEAATAVATFAGGCFWCMEPPFEKLDGVATVVSGYAGGTEDSPSYDEVSAGMFVGWVHAPAAIEWRFPQGAGSITLTTFRVAPEAGPVACHLLDRLVRRASGA